jgi:hypothetical protein
MYYFILNILYHTLKDTILRNGKTMRGKTYIATSYKTIAFMEICDDSISMGNAGLQINI